MLKEKSEKQVADIVHDVVNMDVSIEAIDLFDESSFDAVPARDHESQKREAEFTARIVDGVSRTLFTEPSNLGHREAFPGDGQGALFSIVVADGCGVGKTSMTFSLMSNLVMQAFKDVRDGWSADYVILDPDKDLEFLRRCWQLGAAATPEDLNRTLMNARKAGKLKGLRSQRSYSLDRQFLDSYSFAAEMALRQMQDRLRTETGCERLSLDKLLCNPRHSVAFDGLVRQVVPGHTSLEYRWAAMTLRKARRLAGYPLEMPLFDDVGFVEDLKVSKLPNDPGVYWLVFEDRSAFVGVADSLKVQLDSFAGHLGSSAMPRWIEDQPIGKPKLQILPMAAATARQRELMRSSILLRKGSRLNFMDGSLFSQTAIVA